MGRRIIGNIAIIAIIFGLALMMNTQQKASSPTLDTPSPALGKMVATSFHQALSDPYFLPLEKLTAYLDRHPGMSQVSVDLLSKWAPDDEIPTCFVWNTDGSRMQLDHGADPEVIQQVTKRLQDGLSKTNDSQLLYLKYVHANGEKYWLGFIRIPLGSANPTQMAGAFFSMNQYIESDVPRLIKEVVDRPRFPLAVFHSDSKLMGDRPGAHLSMRILKDNGEVYYQRGQNFDPDKMIYAESQFFSKPIVAMMEGWDLQVFSTNVGSGQRPMAPWMFRGLVILASLIISVIWWIGSAPKTRLIQINQSQGTPAPRPGRGIRLDESKKLDDDTH